VCGVGSSVDGSYGVESSMIDGYVRWMMREQRGNEWNVAPVVCVI